MPEDIIDVIRISHLLCFALGMGAGLYFDLRALRRLNQPFTKDEAEELRHVHNFVFAALFGLWVTGALLIYIRTGFDLANFTPKLWMKLIIVVTLSINSFGIGRIVLPFVRRSVGRCALELPLRAILPMTLTTALSVFCWLSSLVLGASVTFKTADWTVLTTFFAIKLAVVLVGAVLMILTLHTSQRRRTLAKA